MITKVEKIKIGMYMINDAVIVSRIYFYKNHINYDINFDHELVSNEEATMLADSFIRDALVQSTETT